VLIPTTTWARWGFPQCHLTTPQEWNSFMVLEHCQTFYLNPFSDQDNYLMFA
jgi:hypothetical protein